MVRKSQNRVNLVCEQSLSLCGGCSDVSDEVSFIYKVNGPGLDKNGRLHTCLHTCEERT